MGKQMVVIAARTNTVFKTLSDNVSRKRFWLGRFNQAFVLRLKSLPVIRKKSVKLF